jgi:hypothetical protein
VNLPYDSLRGSILCNQSLDVFAATASEVGDADSPWARFAAANRLATKDPTEAVRQLRQILSTPDVETRVWLQAWHCLRAMGENPEAAESRQVHGMVVEVGMDEGVDALAAYNDRSARYFNYSGAAVIWDVKTDEMSAHIEPFLEVARVIGAATEPWLGPHPALPTAGDILIQILTPGGIHIGMGPMNAMQRDPMGAAVIQAAVGLMQALIEVGR